MGLQVSPRPHPTRPQHAHALSQLTGVHFCAQSLQHLRDVHGPARKSSICETAGVLRPRHLFSERDGRQPHPRCVVDAVRGARRKFWQRRPREAGRCAPRLATRCASPHRTAAASQRLAAPSVASQQLSIPLSDTGVIEVFESEMILEREVTFNNAFAALPETPETVETVQPPANS